MPVEISNAPYSPAADAEVWRWVKSLIHDVRRAELQERFAQMIGAWDTVVRAFRRIEDKRIHAGQPTDEDLRFQAACLHDLISVGQDLVLESRKFQPEELASFGVKREQIEAYVRDLEESLRDWHHDVEPEKVSELKKEIFGAST